MRLYKVPRNTDILVLEEVRGPPGQRDRTSAGTSLHFATLDGMYALCYDSFGAEVYIPSWTEVEISPHF